MRTKPLITSILAVTMTLTPMLPTLAAHAASNGNNLNSTVQRLAKQERQAVSNVVQKLVKNTTSNKMNDQRTSITLNGSQVSQPYRIVVNGTTYMPIYYVDKLLQSLGFTAKWNGSLHTWALSNGKSAPSLTINGKVGNATITVNGANVEQNVSIIQAKDPASGVMTTFMPIWYVQQILNAMGFGTDKWDGASNPPTWILATTGSTSEGSTAGSTDPTAADVVNGLLSVYATQQVWPVGLDTGLGWLPGYTQVPNSQWYGLSTVFPNKPASDYAKLLGMTSVPQNQPITAGTLGQWLFTWEKIARLPHSSWYLLKNQPSQDPYTLMSDYSMFYGTDFTGPNSMVTAHDLQMVEQNIKEVDQGYRMLSANKMQVLVPMTTLWNSSQITARALKAADSIVLTFPGQNKVVATAGYVTNQGADMGIGDTYIPSINSGIEASMQFVLKANQPVTMVETLGKGFVVHSTATILKTSPIYTLMPSYLNDNSPIFWISMGGGYVNAPFYYISFSNGKLSRIYVQGTDQNSWPQMESSRFSN